MRSLLALVAVIAGCTPLGEIRAPGGPGFSDSCDTRTQGGLVGQELTDMATVANAAPKVRFINPGDAVTQDVQPDRLNVEFDENRIVTRVYCG